MFNIKSNSVLHALFAGFVGTTAMTIFIHRFPGKKNPQLKVVKVLGTMLTNETTEDGHLSDTIEAQLVGTIAHYSIGEAFSLSYLFLWKTNLLKKNNHNNFLIGVVSGWIGITIWKLFFSIHPNPAKVPLKSYLSLIFTAHIVFAFATAGTYSLLENNKKSFELNRQDLK